MGVYQTLDPSREPWWPEAQNRYAPNRERDLLHQSYGLPMALPAPRVSALGNRLWLLPRLANRRRLGANPRSLARPGARAGRARAAADRGPPRQPDEQDHGSGRPGARV